MNPQQSKIIMVVLILLAAASVTYGIYAWWNYGLSFRLFTFVVPIFLGGGVFFVLAYKKKR